MRSVIVRVFDQPSSFDPKTRAYTPASYIERPGVVEKEDGNRIHVDCGKFGRGLFWRHEIVGEIGA